MRAALRAGDGSGDGKAGVEPCMALAVPQLLFFIRKELCSLL